MLKIDVNYRKEMGKVNKTYINKNIGATAQSMQYINNQISS